MWGPLVPAPSTPPRKRSSRKEKPGVAFHRDAGQQFVLTMARLPNRDSKLNAASSMQRRRTCETCGALLDRKRIGRPARYCSNRCRDKAYEARNFSVFATARIRDKAIRRNSLKKSDTSITCEGVFVDRGLVFSVPLDLIGHASLRFDSPRLDPTVVRTILENELPDDKNCRGQRHD
jgi:hypothetical protein